jgi:hypothetical protein
MSGAENNFEKLLGKNGELVEERKKQVLAGALGIVQRYYKETPNKMEVIAALFGKEIGELFRMKWGNKWVDVEYMCEFTARGLCCYPPAKNDIRINYSNNDWLFLLLIGEAVIVDE